MAGYFETQMKELIEKFKKNGQAAVDKACARISEEVNDEIKKRIVPSAEFEIELAFENAVDAWYQSYTPKAYKRTDSLYGVLDFRGLDGDEIGWDYVDDTLWHPSILYQAEYNIYDMAFERGSHGNKLPPPFSNWTPKVTLSPRIRFEMQTEKIAEKYQNAGREFKRQYYNDHIQEYWDEYFSLE